MSSKENKNIDQFFRDRLQGMETTPPPVVWENIQTALGDKKGDRKVIPLWWKLGGVAATLVLLVTVVNVFMSNNLDAINQDNNQFVIEDSTIISKEIDHNSSQETYTEHEVSNSSKDAFINNSSSVSEKKTNENVILNNYKQISRQKSQSATKDNHTDVASIPSNYELYSKKDKTTKYKNKAVKTTTVATTIDSDKTSTINNTKQTLLNKGIKNNAAPISGTVKDAVVNEEVKEKTETVEKLVNPNQTKESIFDAITDQKEAVTKTDDEVIKDRWSVSPNVAPVYYNTLSQGSSIDPSFADNPQKGEVNMSYGINVSYALSNKLTIRSGISNVNLSYATGGLELATGDASAALHTVAFNRSGTVVTAVDQGVLINTVGTPFENLTSKATEGNVFLTQSISYTEIPTELTYALVNKKIGVNLIGGFSTLLLGNNEVTVSANNFEDVLGEANNLSDVSFSTNVGLGLSYQLSRKFKFNVEPMFKYQLNPYTNTSVQFKPYYVGVYSGLSFKF